MEFKKEASEILKTMLDAVDDSYQKTIGYPTYDILNAMALCVEELLDKMDYYASKLDAKNLTGEELERFVFQRKGLKRKPATFATTTLTITGNATIKKGDLFQTESKIIFESLEDKVIEGSSTILVKAQIAGGYSNVGVHKINSMPTTIAGVVTVDNPEAVENGYNAESDAALYERYLIALQKPATSGNVFHYELWAMEVPGVGAVKVFPLWKGNNTVQVVIVDAERKPAPPELVQAVQDHIDPNSEGLGLGEAPIGACCTVTAAEAVVVDVSVKINGLYDQTEIEASIKEYLKSVAFTKDERLAGYVSYGKIGNAINDAKGVIDYSDLLVNGGQNNVVVPEKSVAVLGTVTINAI